MEIHCSFYRKRLIRCFDEYVTNLTESMNYAQKHSGMSAKPNHSLKNAAKGMNNHAELRFYEKKHTLWSSCTATPLYFKEGCAHNISIMKKI